MPELIIHEARINTLDSLDSRPLSQTEYVDALNWCYNKTVGPVFFFPLSLHAVYVNRAGDFKFPVTVAFSDRKDSLAFKMKWG